MSTRYFSAYAQQFRDQLIKLTRFSGAKRRSDFSAIQNSESDISIQWRVPLFFAKPELVNEVAILVTVGSSSKGLYTQTQYQSLRTK